MRFAALLAVPLVFSACSTSVTSPDAGGAGTDAGLVDGGDAGLVDAGDAGPESDGGSDAGSPLGDAGCFLTSDGVVGECLSTADCAALGDISTPGTCPGPADIQCCTPVPSVASNPAVPAGWKLLPQAEVTSEMTTWAEMILHDGTTYPMFSTAVQTFGSLQVMARVEWHPPDFQSNVVHRGVTLYEPI